MDTDMWQLNHMLAYSYSENAALFKTINTVVHNVHN